MAAHCLRGLFEEEYFHGVLPANEASLILRNHGDFVVLSDKLEPECAQNLFVLCNSTNKVQQACFTTRADGVSLDGQTAKAAVTEVIQHHMHCSKPIGQPPFYLMNPVRRQSWEYRPSDLRLGSRLGKGQFGEVYEGVLKTKDKDELCVAVKQIKADVNVTPEVVQSTIHEVILMKAMGQHQNLVHLYGVILQKPPLRIIMEKISGGSLKDYIRDHSNEIRLRDRLSMCAEAANALAYMHSKRILHCDIAARNCLYSQHTHTLKMSDFGLSQEADAVELDPAKPMPWRWQAIEVLTTFIYTKCADVWSLAVLFWEIFNDGEPYTGMKLDEFLVYLKGGGRLTFSPAYKPPQNLVDTCALCWRARVQDRPTAEQVYNAMKPRETNKLTAHDSADFLRMSDESGKGSRKNKRRGSTKPKLRSA